MPIFHFFMPSELQKLKKEVVLLRRLVYKDPLTGLYNRRGFLEEAEKIFKAALRAGKQRRKKFVIHNLAVIFLDLDDFKKINDRFGHWAGDRVLKETAQILRDSLREIDLIGRWGGEEIVILLVGASRRDALKIGEELRQKISRRQFAVGGRRKINLTASLGVAEVKEKGKRKKEKQKGKRKRGKFEELIVRADKAMYQAKKQGKNRVVAI